MAMPAGGEPAGIDAQSPGIGMGHLGELGGSRASAELEPHKNRALSPAVQTSVGCQEDDQATGGASVRRVMLVGDTGIEQVFRLSGS